MNVFSRWNNIVNYEGQNIRMEKIPESIYNHPKFHISDQCSGKTGNHSDYI